MFRMDSDICLHCNQNINENDKRMEMPCCETVYHTTCAKNMINEAIENYNNSIICSCGELFINFYTLNNTNNTPTNTVIPDEAQGKIKDFKKVLSEFKKNKIIFNKKLKEESASFKEDIEPLIEQVKERRKIGLDIIKASDIYKTVSSSLRNLKTKLTKIHSIFVFDRQTVINELYGGNDRLYYDVKYSRPISTINRSFRIIPRPF